MSGGFSLEAPCQDTSNEYMYLLSRAMNEN